MNHPDSHDPLAEILWEIFLDSPERMTHSRFTRLFLDLLLMRCLSESYQDAVAKEIGSDSVSLASFEAQNPDHMEDLQDQMRRKIGHAFPARLLWDSIARLAAASKPFHPRMREMVQVLRNNPGLEGLLWPSADLDLWGVDPVQGTERLRRTILQIDKALMPMGLIGSYTTKPQGGFPKTFSELLRRIHDHSRKDLPSSSHPPEEIARIMAEIAVHGKTRIGPVLDPACGSASLLLAVRKAAASQPPGKLRGIIPKSRITPEPMQQDPLPRLIAQANMLVHGLKPQEFEIQKSTGNHPSAKWQPGDVGEADVVISFPPMTRRWKPEPMPDEWRLPPNYCEDWAWLLDGLLSLDPQGTMVMCFMDGILFREGPEAKNRRRLVEKGHLHAVVKLPADILFDTGAHISILVMGPQGSCKDGVLFVDASEDFEQRTRRLAALSKEQADRIVRTCQERTQEKDYARLVPLEEIQEKGFNLSVKKYVNAFAGDVDLLPLGSHVPKGSRNLHLRIGNFLLGATKETLPGARWSPDNDLLASTGVQWLKKGYPSPEALLGLAALSLSQRLRDFAAQGLETPPIGTPADVHAMARLEQMLESRTPSLEDAVQLIQRGRHVVLHQKEFDILRECAIPLSEAALGRHWNREERKLLRLLQEHLEEGFDKNGGRAIAWLPPTPASTPS